MEKTKWRYSIYNHVTNKFENGEIERERSDKAWQICYTFEAVGCEVLYLAKVTPLVQKIFIEPLKVLFGKEEADYGCA